MDVLASASASATTGTRSVLSSPFARRLMLLFIISALLPALALGVLTFRYVQHELDAVHERHAQHLIKAAGLNLFDWLLRRDTEIKETIEEVRRGRLKAGQQLPGRDITIEALGTGRRFDAADIKSLRLGHSVFDYAKDQAGDAVYRFSRLVDTAAGELVVTNAVRGMPSAHTVLPPSIAYCFLTADGVPIRCSESMPASVQAAIGAQRQAGYQTYEVDDAGQILHVRTWQIFMGAEFGLRDWKIAVWHDDGDLLASAADFSKMLRPVLLIATLSAVLLAMIAIRRHLRPFHLLTAAAERIGPDNLDVTVDLRSGDELQQLGNAFNAMALRLKRNFEFQSALAAIDRDALTSKDAATTVRALLSGLADLVPHEWSCVWFHDGRSDSLLMMARETGTREPTLRRVPDLSCGDRVLLLSAEAWVEVPLEVQPLCRAGDTPVDHVYAVPLAVGEQAAAVWIAPSRGAPFTTDDEHTFRELAARLAVALVNFSAKEELFQEAHFDTLTGLPNRRLFRDMLDAAILRAPRERHAVGLLFVDLDDFKYVNDSLGHAMGDKLLRAVGHGLRQTVRDTDLVARLGGDEFVVIVPDLPLDEVAASTQLATTAEKLLGELRNPASIDGHELLVRASIGAAIHPRDGANSDELLRSADAAMYSTKDESRGGYTFFSQELNAKATRRIELQAEIARGAERDEFILHYQPQISAADGSVTGCEALLRWQHPTRGLLGPGEFLAEAEATGLIGEIGASALRRAARQLAAWHELGFTDLSMSVNVSARQFDDPHLVALVENIIDDVGIPASSLELEITESTACRRLDHTVEIMTQLAALGVRLAIDDFGTGHSSLSYLQRMPLHTLKVDRSFVIEIGVSTRGESIVDAILALGKCLGLDIVAEGVETEEQLRYLAQRDCDSIQGWLFKPALSSIKFIEYVMERRALARKRVPAARAERHSMPVS